MNIKLKSIITIGVLATITGTAQAQPSASNTLIQQTSFAKAFFISEGSFLGTAIIWFLLLLSAASFGLMGFMWLNNRRINILPEGIVKKAKQLISERKYRELLNLASKEESYFSHVLSSSLREASHGYPAMVRAMEQASDEFMTRRLRRIEVLNVIGNVAPMIGLFGTVFGMILTFQAIVAAGGRPDPVDLAGGIGTALTTTFWGLVVAIPSLAGYALIRNNIDTLTSEASLVVAEIVNQFRPAPNSPHTTATTPTPTAKSSLSTKTPLASAVASTSRKKHPANKPPPNPNPPS